MTKLSDSHSDGTPTPSRSAGAATEPGCAVDRRVLIAGVGGLMAALAASDKAVAATPTRKIVDISMPIENDKPSDPPGLGPKVTYRGHEEMAPVMAKSFPGLKPEDLPGGEGWAIEEIALTTHNGTHLDAPTIIIQPWITENAR